MRYLFDYLIYYFEEPMLSAWGLGASTDWSLACDIIQVKSRLNLPALIYVQRNVYSQSKHCFDKNVGITSSTTGATCSNIVGATSVVQ